MGVYRQEGVVGMCVGRRERGVRVCTNAHTYVSLSKLSNITVRTKMLPSEEFASMVCCQIFIEVLTDLFSLEETFFS